MRRGLILRIATFDLTAREQNMMPWSYMHAARVNGFKRGTERMPRFYEPDLGSEPDSPFARDASNKLVRRSYWLDMNDRSIVMAMTKGIGAHLTNDEKRAHLSDLKRDHLIDQVCIQEIIPPDKR
jgi:hypothetical protein